MKESYDYKEPRSYMQLYGELSAIKDKSFTITSLTNPGGEHFWLVQFFPPVVCLSGKDTLEFLYVPRDSYFIVPKFKDDKGFYY